MQNCSTWNSDSIIGFRVTLALHVNEARWRYRKEGHEYDE